MSVSKVPAKVPAAKTPADKVAVPKTVAEKAPAKKKAAAAKTNPAPGAEARDQDRGAREDGGKAGGQGRDQGCKNEKRRRQGRSR